MIERCRFSFCLLIAFLLVGCNIEGRITSPDGKGTAGVTVTLSGDATLTTQTNSEGYYLFADLNSGNYSVTPVLDGYRWYPQTQEVTVYQDDIYGIDFEGEPTHHIYVPRDYETIQEAVDSASEGDIIWVADGTYTGHGNVDITIDKSIVVQSISGPENCIIDCEGNGRGFLLTGDATLSGLTIVNGFHTRGGAILADIDVSSRIHNCVIEGNHSIEAGGGIYTSGGQSEIINCVISGNTTSHDGGGLSINSGRAKLSGSTIVNNSARVGGGISAINAVVALLSSLVSHNHALDMGGGWYSTDGKQKIKDTIVHDNSALISGAGLYFNQGNVNLRNSTIADNVANQGGGIYAEFGKYIIDHCILWRNTVDQIQSDPEADFEISHAIIGQDDIEGECVSNTDPKFDDDGGYYLIEDSPCGSVADQEE